MMFNLRPPTAVNGLSTLLLFCTFSFFLIASTAFKIHAQTASARLITSSNDTSLFPTRPRVVNASSGSGVVVASTGMIGATSDERKVFELVNAQRRSQGEPSLVWDAELTRMARLHSENMAHQNFFDHKGPDGQGLRERSRANGIVGFRALAENLAYNKGFADVASCAVLGWMRSEGHRDNMLNAEFTRSGIGIARSADGRVYITQVFVAR
jgi:uncharacterized protein YkwD